MILQGFQAFLNALDLLDGGPIGARGAHDIVIYIIDGGLFELPLLQLVLIDLVVHLVAFELLCCEGSGCRFWKSVRIGCIGPGHRRRRLKKLWPLLIAVECGFDIAPDVIVVGLGLDNRQPPRPIGLGL